MSKKRSSTEPNEDDQTNEGSESLFQRKDNNKRARFHSVSETTLQDLPIELLECILVKVVAMEVKSLKLAKSVWEEKADLVISRLRIVCPQWNSILTTNYFRKKLHRTFDAVQQTFRLEIAHESTIKRGVFSFASLRNDIFMIYNVDPSDDHYTYVIEVYDRNNMAEVKDVISIPGLTVDTRMRSCNVSNCVYVLIQTNNSYCLSVLRISKDTEDKFNVAPWEYDYELPISMLSVSANGNLLILSLQQQPEPHLVSIYNADGSLQHRIKLPPDSDLIGHEGIVQKSNGNLVMFYVNIPNYKARLLEIDTNGSVVRQYETALSFSSFLHFADVYGRIVIAKPFNGIKLLDSEFNLLGDYSLQKVEDEPLCVFGSHYDSERSEIVRIYCDYIAQTMFFSVIRFTEE